MRIDHLFVTAPLKHRVVWAEIDREARKGKPLPSDHAPLIIDIDSPSSPSMPAGLRRRRESRCARAKALRILTSSRLELTVGWRHESVVRLVLYFTGMSI